MIGFYNRDEKFYCAVWTGSLNKAVCASSLKGLNDIIFTSFVEGNLFL